MEQIQDGRTIGATHHQRAGGRRKLDQAKRSRSSVVFRWFVDHPPHSPIKIRGRFSTTKGTMSPTVGARRKDDEAHMDPFSYFSCLFPVVVICLCVEKDITQDDFFDDCFVMAGNDGIIHQEAAACACILGPLRRCRRISHIFLGSIYKECLSENQSLKVKN